MEKVFDVFLKCQTLSDKLSFSHYCEFIWNDDFKIINYYMSISITQNLSVRQLRGRIKSREYESLPEHAKNKLISKNNMNIVDYVKNPIIIKIVTMKLLLKRFYKN